MLCIENVINSLDCFIVTCWDAAAAFYVLCILWLLLRPGRGAEYCDQSVCLCICLSVCPEAYLLNHWTDRHEICCADLLWPWLGPPLAALRYRGGVWCLWMPCYSAPVGVLDIVINPSACLYVCLSVCLPASISLEPLDRSLRNLLRRSPVAVARSSSCGVSIRYVLPVLRMTWRLAVVGRVAMRG